MFKTPSPFTFKVGGWAVIGCGIPLLVERLSWSDETANAGAFMIAFGLYLLSLSIGARHGYLDTAPVIVPGSTTYVVDPID